MKASHEVQLGSVQPYCFYDRWRVRAGQSVDIKFAGDWDPLALAGQDMRGKHSHMSKFCLALVLDGKSYITSNLGGVDRQLRMGMVPAATISLLLTVLYLSIYLSLFLSFFNLITYLSSYLSIYLSLSFI
jgi:hypothetical protein